MKLRLRVSLPGQAPFEYDVAGSVCTLGRDAACELPFVDKTSSVSWRHARIDLGPDGAWLSDLQSSNGTFVNDQRVTGRVLLKTGDEVRLGKGGPSVTVIQAGPPSGRFAQASVAGPSAGWSSTPTSSSGEAFPLKGLVVGMVLFALAALVVGMGFLVLRQTGRLRDLREEVQDLRKMVGDLGERTKGLDQTVRKLGERTKELELEISGDVKGSLDLPPPPRTNRVVLGQVGPPLKDVPGVLLSSQGSGWKRLRADDPVSSMEVLTALPGFKSEVHLKSGVRVLLWGDLTLHETLPVLESRLVLHEPPAGVDLDLTVERGRFVLSNHKDKGEAVIRVRFRDSTWEARLPDKSSAVAIELRGGYLIGAPVRIDGKGDLPITLLNFATRGKTEIKVLKAPQPGKNADMLTFRLLLREEADKLWPELASWWAGKFEQPEDTRKVYRQLLDFLDQAAATPVEQLRKAQQAEGLSPTAQVVSVFSLGAVEDLTGVLAALEDKRSPAVREAGLVVLRQWLGRSGDNDRKARDYLVAQHGFSDERARRAVEWLHGLSEADRKRATASRLFAGLDDPRLAMRQLASWRLSEWLPPPEGVSYDAAAAPEERKEAVSRWKTSVPAALKPE